MRPSLFSFSPQTYFHLETHATSSGRCIRATLEASIRCMRTFSLHMSNQLVQPRRMPPFLIRFKARCAMPSMRA